MARYRAHSSLLSGRSLEYLPGETLHGSAKRHDVTRNLIRVRVRKYEEGAFDDDAQAADPYPRIRSPDRCP
jgi:transposase